MWSTVARAVLGLVDAWRAGWRSGAGPGAGPVPVRAAVSVVLEVGRVAGDGAGAGAQRSPGSASPQLWAHGDTAGVLACLDVLELVEEPCDVVCHKAPGHALRELDPQCEGVDAWGRLRRWRQVTGSWPR